MDYWFSLHTGDPSGGNQATHEATYAGYARARAANDAFSVAFPEATGGGGHMTHFAVGTDATGEGKILCCGEIVPVGLTVSQGVTPELTHLHLPEL